MNLRLFIKNETINKFLVALVFIIYFIVGFAIYDDYGISTDENTERVTATYALLYSVNKISELVHADSVSQKIKQKLDPELYVNYKYNIYGNNFQMPLLLLEVAFFGINKSPNKEIFEFRHLITFLFFYLSVVIFYFLIKNIYENRTVAIITTIILIITPRFFAESFYNPKDIVFFSACIIGMFFYVNFLKEKSLKNGVLLGIFTAYAAGFRIFGIQFIMMAIFILLLDFILTKRIKNNEVKSLIAAIIVFIILIIIFYPASWHSPISFFKMLFAKVARYHHHSVTLFMGEWVHSDNAPWYYIPVWMLITIPILYIILFLHGLFNASIKLIKFSELREFSFNYQVILSAFIMFFVPILGIMINKTSVFNGWRHVSFLYLPFLIIVAYSLNVILNFAKRTGKSLIVISIITVYFIFIGIWMVINHPYQFAFFNAIPRNIEANYQKDYWGLSMVDGMKYVLNIDSSPKIIIKKSKGTAKHSRNKLPDNLKKRIEIMPDNSLIPNKYDYFFYNGDHYGTKDYAVKNNLREIHSIEVYNSIYTQKYKIMKIYKKSTSH